MKVLCKNSVQKILQNSQENTNRRAFGGTIVKNFFCNFNVFFIKPIAKIQSNEKIKEKFFLSGPILDFLGKMTKNREKRCDKYL